MNFNELTKAVEIAIQSIDEYSVLHGESAVLNSIKTQMEFINGCAKRNINPLHELKDKKFSYAILASREFASPEELLIKQKLENVSHILDKN